MRKIILIVTSAAAVLALSYFFFAPAAAVEIPTLETWRQAYPEKIKTFTIESRPIAIEPHLHHPGTTTIDVVSAPEDMWVIGFKPEIINGPSSLLHHANYVNRTDGSGRLDSCSAAASPFFASGREMTWGFLPPPYGFPIKGGDSISALAMYHNESEQAYENVQTRLTVWYIPKTEADLEEVQTLLMDLFRPCVFGDYMVPPHTKNLEKKTETPFVVSIPGKVVLFGGHVHDYANFITLKRNGKTVEKIVPEKDEEGRILKIPIMYPADFELEPGDRLSVETSTDNPMHHEVDAMAQMLLFVHRTDR